VVPVILASTFNTVWQVTGPGQFVGVTISILQNQDGWWGEGDDMFFRQRRNGTLYQGQRLRELFLKAPNKT